MKSIQPNDPVTLDDLITAYLRLKEWMDYDLERSAYCAKEIIVMQALFKTAYIKVPFNLANASHEEMLNAMEERQVKLTALTRAVDASADEDEIDDLLRDVDKSTFKSTVHYFTTLHEAICQAIQGAGIEDDAYSGKCTIDAEPIEEHFEEIDENSFEYIRSLIISEHPEIEFINFPIENVYALALPRQAPAPMNHNQSHIC